MPLDRAILLPETDLPTGAELLAEGRTLARDWGVGPSAFLTHVGQPSEHDFKLATMGRRVMLHAQLGYRDPGRSIGAYAQIWEACAARGTTLDRYGLCLDWSMAVPRARRAGAMRGTGMILTGPEDFAALANAAPAAAHFGDFVLGFPAALENTQAALAAGATTIGNLGQYFTFRIPGHDDDIEATQATLRALGLMAAQPVTVMAHSNIDDGYAAQFTDLASCLGVVLIERDICERLVGVKIAHCYGHHFSDPLGRIAFQRALALAGGTPGSMIYGNTTSYRGTAAQNYGGLASYLLADALGQLTQPTGHAINAVPVTENDRIPDIDEVIEAQLFAGSMARHAEAWPQLTDPAPVDALAARIHAGGVAFRDNVLRGLGESGVDTKCAFEMLLSLRRLGARRLERDFGAGPLDAKVIGGRAPLVPATILSEIAEMSEAALHGAPQEAIARVRARCPRVMTATSDVHEHGKMLIEDIARRIGAEPLDGGVSTDPDRLARLAAAERPDAIALSTYNGVALTYFNALQAALRDEGLDIPVLIGGRLNQIPDQSNSSLPVDVGTELTQAGALVCTDAKDLLSTLDRLFGSKP
jgi:methylmalonyl-CoA mutase cobalamin-binding subunit